MAFNSSQPQSSVVRIAPREYEQLQNQATIAKREMQALMETITPKKETSHE